MITGIALLLAGIALLDTAKNIGIAITIIVLAGLKTLAGIISFGIDIGKIIKNND